jgi:hypothetical protein
MVFFIGLLTLFVGERLVGGYGGPRWIVSGLGAFAVLTAWIVYLLAWIKSPKGARSIDGLAFLLSSLGLVAVGVYGLASEWSLAGGLHQVLQVSWPILLVCSLFPLLFLQWSLAGMGRGPGVETGRVKTSVYSGASLAIFVSTLFFINAIANKKDLHVDLSYFKTTSPSVGSCDLVKALDEDTQALLFFPKVNEVMDEIEPYFSRLAELSQHFSYQRIDRAMHPQKARDLKVTKDGSIVLVRSGANQKIALADKLDQAKSKLSRFDQSFQRALLELTSKQEVIYMVTGHGERLDSANPDDTRTSISKLQRHLGTLNYTIETIDATTGLTDKIPDDAALLLWVGPSAVVYPGEIDTISAYLDNGGRMLLLLDPESPEQPDTLLDHLGLALDRNLLANSSAFYPVSRTPADRYNLGTRRFSSHPAVTALSRHSQQLPVGLPTVGSLEKTKTSASNKINFVIRSEPGTWADADGDHKRGENEKTKTFQMAAAISRSLGEDPKTPSKRAKEMRAMVFADADLFADVFFKNIGNQVLLVGSLNWLLGEKRISSVAESEEDLPLRHTHVGETVWFYGSVFFVPVLILGLGVVTRWGRGRKRRATS